MGFHKWLTKLLIFASVLALFFDSNAGFPLLPTIGAGMLTVGTVVYYLYYYTQIYPKNRPFGQ